MKESLVTLDQSRVPMALPVYDQGFVDGYLAARGHEFSPDVALLTALEVLDHLRDGQQQHSEMSA